MAKCPNQYAGEMANAIDLFDCYGKGILPVSGGALDQSAWFVRAAKVYQIEESLARNLKNG